MATRRELEAQVQRLTKELEAATKNLANLPTHEVVCVYLEDLFTAMRAGRSYKQAIDQYSFPFPPEGIRLEDSRVMNKTGNWFGHDKYGTVYVLAVN